MKLSPRGFILMQACVRIQIRDFNHKKIMRAASLEFKRGGWTGRIFVAANGQWESLEQINFDPGSGSRPHFAYPCRVYLWDRAEITLCSNCFCGEDLLAVRKPRVRFSPTLTITSADLYGFPGRCVPCLLPFALKSKLYGFSVEEIYAEFSQQKLHR
jgi:hypothetical protein